MIAVTGANGLLGNLILRKLLAEKVEFVALKRATGNISGLKDLDSKINWRDMDILDPVSLREALTGVSGVIHAAAVVSFGKWDKKKILQTNLHGTRNVVDSCLDLGIKRLLHVSSVAALGKNNTGEISEDDIFNPDSITDPYAESKFLAELEIFRGQEEGLQTVIINPSVILSPMNNNRSSGRILYYLNKFRSFYIDGAFNYVDGRDVADIIYSLYKSNLFGEKFIANAGCITFKTLGEKIAGLRGYSPPTIRISDTLLKVLALSSGKSMPAKSMDIIGQNRTFQNKKVRNILNFEFQPIDATLRWCCNMP